MYYKDSLEAEYTHKTNLLSHPNVSRAGQNGADLTSDTRLLEETHQKPLKQKMSFHPQFKYDIENKMQEYCFGLCAILEGLKRGKTTKICKIRQNSKHILRCAFGNRMNGF